MKCENILLFIIIPNNRGDYWKNNIIANFFYFFYLTIFEIHKNNLYNCIELCFIIMF